MPLLLLSKSDNASIPPFAFVPSDVTVFSPNNSRPLSIFPLLFLSNTNIPSCPLTHEIFWAKPSLSMSKFVPLSRSVRDIFPSPSRSNISGSEGSASSLSASFSSSLCSAFKWKVRPGFSTSSNSSSVNSSFKSSSGISSSGFSPSPSGFGFSPSPSGSGFSPSPSGFGFSPSPLPSSGSDSLLPSGLSERVPSSSYKYIPRSPFLKFSIFVLPTIKSRPE